MKCTPLPAHDWRVSTPLIKRVCVPAAAFLYDWVQEGRRFDPEVLEVEFISKAAPFFYFYNEAGKKVRREIRCVVCGCFSFTIHDVQIGQANAERMTPEQLCVVLATRGIYPSDGRSYEWGETVEEWQPAQVENNWGGAGEEKKKPTKGGERPPPKKGEEKPPMKGEGNPKKKGGEKSPPQKGKGSDSTGTPPKKVRGLGVARCIYALRLARCTVGM